MSDDVREGSFQERVGKWMEACFTPKIIADKLERADRFIEEALELVQATGYSADRAHALVDYVFGRPIGEPIQEVGGVRVTLSALCNPHGIDEDAAAEAELSRIWTKIDKIREKQASKPVGSALPLPAAQPQPSGDVREAAQAVIDAAFDHYTARNGRRCSIEGDDGEKCWIVPFDQFEDLRRALTAQAKALNPGELSDVELEDALTSEGIYVFGPDAERFQRMFAVVMRLRGGVHR